MDLIEDAGGFPWLAVAGKTLAGWVAIDMDATLITAHSGKEKATPTWKKGYGFHPLAAWCMNTRECLDMMLRPGSAGSNTFADHKEVLDRALKQVPARFRRKILVRIDGAGASHKLIEYLLTLTTSRKTLLFTCGWTILEADEAAIAALPGAAWQPGLLQDGGLEGDKDVAEITHLMSRAGIWPEGLRFIARRVKPSRRHQKNMTAFERKTGWKYSITCTNIGHTGMDGVPGSQHPQFIDVLQRDHATVETDGVRTAKAMVLAATLSAHGSAAFDVHVLAGLGGDGCWAAGQVLPLSWLVRRRARTSMVSSSSALISACWSAVCWARKLAASWFHRADACSSCSAAWCPAS